MLILLEILQSIVIAENSHKVKFNFFNSKICKFIQWFLRSHTQEKNYICEVCEKGFTNASDLGKHKLIHDPVKRFRCEECHRNFTQKVHLRKHCEKHHPDMNFDIVFKLENKNETKIILEECVVEEEGEEMEQDDQETKESIEIVLGS